MANVIVIHNHPIHYKDALFSELSKRGMNFQVIFLAASSRFRKSVPEPLPYNCKVAYDGNYESLPQLLSAHFVWRQLEKCDPDVVIISGYIDLAAWVAWLWAEMKKKPKVFWSESNQYDRPRTRWKEYIKRLYVRRFQVAHVYGESNKRYLTSLGMPERSVLVGRATVDLSASTCILRKAAAKTGPKTLLYLGRFSTEKNVGFLIEAFARFTRRHTEHMVKLALAGYGSLEPSIRERVADLGLQHIVEFWGYADRLDVPQMLQASDILVLPSVSETWGLVVLEAMLCGIPVMVSTNCGCAADLVSPETGWTFDPTDEDELASLISIVAVETRQRLQCMGEKARVLAQRYTPERAADGVLNSIALARSIMTQNGKGTPPHPSYSNAAR